MCEFYSFKFDLQHFISFSLLLFKKENWVLALLLCICTNSRAQTEAIKKFRQDSETVQILYATGAKQKDPDSAINTLKEGLQKAIDMKYALKCSDILLKIGEDYLNKGDCIQAITYTKQAFPYTLQLPPIEKCNYYQHLGWIYFSVADYVAACENYYLALDYFKQSDLIRPNEIDICNNLGIVYSRLHQNEKAVYYFDLSEAKARQFTTLYNKDHNYLAIVLISKGEFYTGLHETDSARKCYNEAIDIANKIGRLDLKTMAIEGIGKTFIESGDYQKAINYLQTAISLSENKDEPTWIESSFYLGEAWYKLGKYAQAEAVLVAALKDANATNLKDNTIKGYTTLTAVYKATRQYTKAIDCMDSIKVLEDSFENAEKVKAINLMDIKFQTAEKDKQIAVQTGKLARKNMWMLGIGCGVILVMLFSVGLYLHTLNKQRSLEKENKIEILNAAIHGGDSERSRIARELHDGIGGMLSAAMMRFSSMHHDNAAITQTPAYKDAMNILREMGDEIRKTAHNLMPDVLLKQSLPDAVRAYCNMVQESGALKIDFQCYGSFNELSQHHKLNLYRIVQELVKNVIQHSGATRAMVQLLQNENTLIVSVEDNGIGFNKNELRSGLGLYNTQTRVSSMDGKFTLESTTGKGTSVFIEIEVPEPANREITDKPS